MKEKTFKILKFECKVYRLCVKYKILKYATILLFSYTILLHFGYRHILINFYEAAKLPENSE